MVKFPALDICKGKKKNGKNVKRAAIDGKGRAQQAGKQEPREGEYAVADGSRFPLSS